jgi:hypothetical protein
MQDSSQDKAVQHSIPVLPAGGSVYVVAAASMGSGKLLSSIDWKEFIHDLNYYIN